jgi:hypothetical protein
MQGACQAAIGMAFQDFLGGYAHWISPQTSNRHAQNGRYFMQLSWPTLRRSLSNCPAALANSHGELRRAHATYAIAAKKTLLPDSLRNAWEAVQRASPHGGVGNYVHKYVIQFNRFGNFSHSRFLATICHPAATAESISEWIADGMICSRRWPTNTRR